MAERERDKQRQSGGYSHIEEGPRYEKLHALPSTKRRKWSIAIKMKSYRDRGALVSHLDLQIHTEMRYSEWSLALFAKKKKEIDKEPNRSSVTR